MAIKNNTRKSGWRKALRAFFGGNLAAATPGRRSFRPGVEGLERRELLANSRG